MADDAKREHSIDELENWNVDRTVDPPTKVVGIMKKSGGAWTYWDGTIATTASPLSADSSSISAKQGDASNLRTSSIIDNGSVSAKSGDANQLHVSAVQGDAGLFRISAYADDAGKMRISGIGTFTVSAHEVKQSDAASLLVSAKTDSASQFRTSSFVDSGSISAKQSDAVNLNVSAKSGDAGTLRISAFNSDAGKFLVSAEMYDAEYGDGPNVVVSARSVTPTSAMKGLVATNLAPDAQYMRTSAFQTDGANQRVSSLQSDASLQRVSSMQTDGANQRVSSLQNDAGLQRVSASPFANSLGSYSVYKSISVSANSAVSATIVKSSAGALYGIDAFYVSATTPAYLKLYNIAAAAAISASTPFIVYCLSGAAGTARNISIDYPAGITFNTGIGIAAVSAHADNGTTVMAASSVIVNLYYV